MGSDLGYGLIEPDPSHSGRPLTRSHLYRPTATTGL
jgi:hypothetical protein